MVVLTDPQVREVREKFAAGARQVDLAAEYGINQNTVSSLVTGRVRESAGGPISRASARKLTPDDVIAIRDAVAGGTHHTVLAERYSVSQQMVSNIAAGRAYTDLGGPIQGRPAHARPLTVEQVDEIRRRLAAGESHNELAAAFGVSRWTIESVLRGATTGVSKAERDGIRDEVTRMRALYRDGTSQSEIARMFNTSQQRVSMIVRGQLHISHGGPIAGMQRHRLTTDQVTRIRDAFAVNASLDELAERYSVSNSIIRQVVTGATYPNVPGPTFTLDRRGRIVRPE